MVIQNCLTFVFVLFLLSCSRVEKKVASSTEVQEEIIDTYLRNGAWKYHYLSKEWEEWINKGLEKDSNVAYLWQQKALPYWKQKKYSQAIRLYRRAVELDPQRWLSRLGFLKCVFAKNYASALEDLSLSREKYGLIYEQDHSLEFYMGLCFLQLNKYENAKSILEQSVMSEREKSGPDWVHYLDYYYLGIAFYELGNYEQAIVQFDHALKNYPKFSDGQFYKSICLNYLNKPGEAKALMIEAKQNYENGNSFNEDSSRYEYYPYQLTWQWTSCLAMLKV